MKSARCEGRFVAVGSLVIQLRGLCQFTGQAEKTRGAWQNHKRLPYNSISLYRTSLDHLLLGRNADIDKTVE